MDPLTHYMLAYYLGRKLKLDIISLRALIFSAFLPDIDVFTIILGWNFVEGFHGTVTHSFVVAILFSMIISMFFLVNYKKNVFHYSLIGVFMHFFLDFSMTLMPEWRDQGMMLLFPFSLERFALRNYIPYSIWIGILLMGFLFIFGIYLFYYYVKKKEYPWRIWIDERKILNSLHLNGKNRN